MADLVTPSGQRLHVEEAGCGPPILLVHGWGMAGEIFAPIEASLRAEHRTIRYDLRGHGRSAPAPSATLDDHARDLAAVAEHFALDGALVVAWSLGALVFLRALPAIRGRVAGAALIGATPRFTAGDGWSDGLPPRHLEVLVQRYRRDPARTRARFLVDQLSAGERAGGDGAAAGALTAALPMPDDSAALAGLEILATEDLRAALPGVDRPVLLLHGEEDPICPAGASRELARRIPGARLELLPGAGHAPFLTQPERIAGSLRAFLGGLR